MSVNVKNQVRNLPGRYRDLSRVLGVGGTGAGEYVSGGSHESRVPISGRVTDVRADVVRVLHEWAAVFAEAAGIDAAVFGRDPANTAMLILGAWSSAPFIDFDKFGSDIGDLVRRCDDALAPGDRGRVELTGRMPRDPLASHRCPDCDGSLMAKLDRDDGAKSVIMCLICLREWVPQEWSVFAA